MRAVASRRVAFVDDVIAIGALPTEGIAWQAPLAGDAALVRSPGLVGAGDGWAEDWA